MTSIKRKLIILLTGFTFLVTLTEFVVQVQLTSSQFIEAALTNAVKKSKEREQTFLDFLSDSKQTLRALRQSRKFNLLVKEPNNTLPFTELALDIASSQPEIMKIRFLDARGTEVVRIDRDLLGDMAVITPPFLLQDKSERYFFSESLTKESETIWFSALDLNVDYGEVELPYKPTLRAMMPISNPDHSFAGVLMINYFATPLLEQLFNTPMYKMILADSEGEVLLHHDPNFNWSRYRDTAPLSELIAHSEQALQNPTFKAEEYFSRRLELPLSNQLTLILSLNPEHLSRQQSHFTKSALLSSLITLLIAALFCLVVVSQSKRFFAEFDKRGRHIAKLKELNQKIKALLHTNRVYMELASDGITILDANGDVVDCSHSFANMLGYTVEETKQLNVRDWDKLIPPSQMKAKFQEFTKGPTKFETKHQRKDGTIRDVEVHAKWISTGEGEFLYASTRDITERKQMEAELHQLATTDELTQLPSRRSFMQRLSEEIERCRRYPDAQVAVVMLDIDYFKSINDNYGHVTGDLVLKHIAAVITGELRRVDMVGRLGGEEFGLILLGCTIETAHQYCQRLRQRIADSPLIHSDHVFKTTVSMGVTTINNADMESAQILDRADQALYQAKRLGRNRVELFDNSLLGGTSKSTPG